jgi:hypothetical protein
MNAPGWKTLGLSVFLSTGNVIAVILLAVFQRLFLPGGSVILLVIPLSFLVNWLVFVTPLTTATQGLQYWKAARQTLLTAFIASCFTLAGMLPVLVLLSFRWFPNDVDLTSPLFWIMMTACGIAGAVVVYPFCYWMAHRNLDIWPARMIDGYRMEPAGNEKRLPKLRDAWGALLLGLIIPIALVGALIMLLS